MRIATGDLLCRQCGATRSFSTRWSQMDDWTNAASMVAANREGLTLRNGARTSGSGTTLIATEGRMRDHIDKRVDACMRVRVHAHAHRHGGCSHARSCVRCLQVPRYVCAECSHQFCRRYPRRGLKLKKGSKPGCQARPPTPFTIANTLLSSSCRLAPSRPDLYPTHRPRSQPIVLPPFPHSSLSGSAAICCVSLPLSGECKCL